MPSHRPPPAAPAPPRRRRIRLWRAVALLPLLLAAVLVVIGQAGGLRGAPPVPLGVVDGRLAPPSTTDNSVSSQAGLWAGHPRREAARVAPLPASDGPEAALARVRAAALAQPGATLAAEAPGYLHFTFTSRWLGFVDDTEFWYDPALQVVQVRSASRLGRRDFGVNRARVEAIRAAATPS